MRHIDTEFEFERSERGRQEIQASHHEEKGKE
jgi:hypothetical protein